MELDSGQLKWKDEECLERAEGELQIAPLCQKDTVKADKPELVCPEGWAELNSSCLQFQSKPLN